jgi:hypothetical protein
VNDVVTSLLSAPVPLTEATAPAVAGGAPAVPGLYAWWAAPGTVPGIVGPSHPSAELELLYIGIAPNRAASGSTLRSRLVRNHIRGTTGSSTLRRSLASLLSEKKGWRSRWTTRPVLLEDDEERLSRCMEEVLRVTWAGHPEPWTVERSTIEQLKPPLNQADNQGHPLYRFVREARARWRKGAAGQRMTGTQ